MFFWFFMLCMVLLIPLTMVGCGRYFIKGGPRDINDLFGYRTALSTRNRDTWLFAHQYCGRLWLLLGRWVLVLSVLVFLPFWGKDPDTIGLAGGYICLVQTVPLLAPVFFTQRALKQAFDQYGRRR
ncbi:MAG: SdpI family protein [Oscillospiraceae bacterium]|nr:SdpI family protein [Oscillospiraceae bacterium]